jgi:hypothetical protein
MILHVSTDDGDVEIHEHALATITEADLKKLRMSRDDLYRCFAEGLRLMEESEVKPADRVRPFAERTLDGEWEVHLVRCSPN